MCIRDRNYKSYVNKTFVVESSKSIIRDEELKERRYQAGDDILPGKRIGDVKTVPQRTEIKVRDVKTDSGRHTFVLAAAASSDRVYGWTAAMNLEGGCKNETAGLAPAKWDLEPSGTNMTCIDANALIRDGAPAFASKGTSIPLRSFVSVTETSADGKFVKVSKIQ